LRTYSVQSMSTSTQTTASLKDADVTKFVRPDRGPFSCVCLYETPVRFTVVGHAGFAIVMYDGKDKAEADRIFFDVVDKYQPEPEPEPEPTNLDDEL